jgi:hypothetical protein
VRSSGRRNTSSDCIPPAGPHRGRREQCAGIAAPRSDRPTLRSRLVPRTIGAATRGHDGFLAPTVRVSVRVAKRTLDSLHSHRGRVLTHCRLPVRPPGGPSRRSRAGADTGTVW